MNSISRQKIELWRITAEGQICLYPYENLATEIFKVKNGLSPIIMNEVFNFQEKKTAI